MSCHSLSSPGVQLPAGTERPRPHPWWHQPGDQSSGHCSLWEAEAWQCPEWVLLGEELTLPQHHQRRDRPHHHLPLQRVRQVGRIGPGTGSKCVMNKAPVGSGPGWSKMSQVEKEPRLSSFSSYHPWGRHGTSWKVDLVSDSEYGPSDVLNKIEESRENH